MFGKFSVEREHAQCARERERAQESAISCGYAFVYKSTRTQAHSELSRVSGQTERLIAREGGRDRQLHLIAVASLYGLFT